MSLCTGAFLGDITGGSVYDLAGFRWCCSIEGFVVGGLVNKYILVQWEPEYSGIGRRLEDVSYTINMRSSDFLKYADTYYTLMSSSYPAVRYFIDWVQSWKL